MEKKDESTKTVAKQKGDPDFNEEMHNSVPIFEEMKKSLSQTFMKAPGHKLEGFDPEQMEFFGSNMLHCDVQNGAPPLPLGHLQEHETNYCIGKAANLYADLQRVKETLFSVQGTSMMVMAMIAGTVGHKDVVLIPSNLHRSIMNGLIICGAKSVIMPVQFDKHYGILHNILPETVKKYVELYPEAKAVIISSPTYHGAVADIKKIEEIVHNSGKLLLVDEAWGAHMPFHEKMPTSAIYLGADVVTHSTHKLGGSLIQSAVLHIWSNRVSKAQILRAYNMLLTTSYSQLLLVSLDFARRHFAFKGRKLIQNAIELGKYAKEKLAQIPGIEVLDEKTLNANPQNGVFALDPTRVVVFTKKLGVSGSDLQRFLFEKHQIAGCNPALCSLILFGTFGDTKQVWDKVIAAVADFSQKVEVTKEIPKTMLEFNLFEKQEMPTMRMGIRDALELPSEEVKFKESINLWSAELIYAYPPGIPILFPGQIISQANIDWILGLFKHNITVSGQIDPTMQTIRVINQQAIVNELLLEDSQTRAQKQKNGHKE